MSATSDKQYKILKTAVESMIAEMNSQGEKLCNAHLAHFSEIPFHVAETLQGALDQAKKLEGDE